MRARAGWGVGGAVMAAVVVSWPASAWALSITNVQVVNRTDTQATITWDSDVAASSEVTLNLGSGSAQVASRDESVTSHVITVTGLTALTDYTLQVGGMGDDGSTATVDGPGFSTERPPTYLKYADWSNGPPSDPNYFPLHVWLQSPGNAGEFADIGINLYTGLYGGPTTDQLMTLAAANMPAIADQNDVALGDPNESILWGWSQQDEPDNAQSDGMGGYGPCVDPQTIVDLYDQMTTADATRPVFLNVGQSVAWDLDNPWVGRGVCSGQWDDYANYFDGADIISFDIYPVTSGDAPIQGNLWRVALGVDRLRMWSNDEKIVWNWIETTHISSDALPTPHDVRAEVWMSLVHGSMGIGYFVHEFAPGFIEDGIFAHPEIVDAVTAINAQITDLAPVLNTTSMADAITVDSSDPMVPVDTMVKRSDGSTYVFAVAMRDSATTGTFTLFAHSTATTAEVIGEDRSVDVSDGSFTDDFAGYDVHLYKIDGPLDGMPDGGGSGTGGGADSTGGTGGGSASAGGSGGATAGASGGGSGGGGATDGGSTGSCDTEPCESGGGGDHGCGCTAGDSGPNFAALSLWLGLLGFRRRRPTNVSRDRLARDVCERGDGREPR